MTRQPRECSLAPSIQHDRLRGTMHRRTMKEGIMGISYRKKAAIVAVATFLTCLGLLWKQDVGAESPRIVDGSNVTAFYRITAPGECGFEIRVLGQFVQGQHQLMPALE